MAKSVVRMAGNSTLERRPHVWAPGHVFSLVATFKLCSSRSLCMNLYMFSYGDCETAFRIKSSLKHHG